jgi:formylglycine-generating enzyme required for sulfatase activity
MASTTSIFWQVLLITVLLTVLKIYVTEAANPQIELMSVCVGIVFLGLLSFRLYNINSSEKHTLWNFLIKFGVFSLIFGGTVLMILPYEEAQLMGFFWSFFATIFMGTLSQMGQQGEKDDSPFFSFFILLFVGFYTFTGIIAKLNDLQLLSTEKEGLYYLVPAAEVLPLEIVRQIQMLLIIPNVIMLGLQLIKRGLFDKIIEPLRLFVRPVKDMRADGMWFFINSLSLWKGIENPINLLFTIINVLIWMINLVIRLVVFVSMAVGSTIKTFYEVLLPKIKQWGKLVSLILIGVITLFIPFFAAPIGGLFYKLINYRSWYSVDQDIVRFILVFIAFFILTFIVRLFLLMAFRAEKYAVNKMLGDTWRVMRYAMVLLALCYVTSHSFVALTHRTIWFSSSFVIALVSTFLLILPYLQKREKTEEEESVCYHIRFFDLAFLTRFYSEDTIEKKDVAEKKNPVARKDVAEKKDAVEMVYIKGGTFQMGGNEYDREKPIHSVTLSSFYLSKYQVTQKQWTEIMGNNSSHFKGEDLPVEKVCWNDAQTFLQKLNEKTGKKYRLPTEAEWEYAARGGNQSQGYKYAGSSNLDEVGWYNKNSGNKTHPVGEKKPNELGLYDMSGNVWEWCEDIWHENYLGAPEDGTAWLTDGDSRRRVLRGGSWGDDDYVSRVAVRYRLDPADRYYDVGFRLARD